MSKLNENKGGISPEWQVYIHSIEDDGEGFIDEVEVPKNQEYEFNVDYALDHMDLKFGSYTPSRNALEFFNLSVFLSMVLA